MLEQQHLSLYIYKRTFIQRVMGLFRSVYVCLLFERKYMCCQELMQKAEFFFNSEVVSSCLYSVYSLHYAERELSVLLLKLLFVVLVCLITLIVSVYVFYCCDIYVAIATKQKVAVLGFHFKVHGLNICMWKSMQIHLSSQMNCYR